MQALTAVAEQPDRSACPLDTRLCPVWNAVFGAPSQLASELSRLLPPLQAVPATGLPDISQVDSESQGVLVALQAFDCVERGTLSDAQSALERVRSQVQRMGSRRGLWLCEDLQALLALRQGDHATAHASLQSNRRRPTRARGLGEQAFSCWIQLRMQIGCSEFELALETGHRLLTLAHKGDLKVAEGIALLSLAAVHIMVLDFTQGLRLQDSAARCLRTAGANDLLELCQANRIYTYFASGHPEAAVAVLREWQADGFQFPASCHSVAWSLAHLAAGELDRAQELLGHTPPQQAQERHQRCAWHWVRGRLLLARGQPQAARQLCRDWLDNPPDAVADTPLNLVQLHALVRDACEQCGDLRGALDAAEAMRQIEAPQLAPYARIRHRSLRMQSPGGAVDAPGERSRLDTVSAAIEQHSQDWQEASSLAATTPADETGRTRRFVAQVSHEMRTPLGGVIGLTALLLQSELDAQQRRLVTLAHDAANSMMHLLDDIIDLARLDAGRFRVEARPFSPSALVQDVAAPFEPLAQERGLRLDLSVSPALPDPLIGDAQRLRQVLNNLLGNAMKFTRRGGILLRLMGRSGGHGLCALRIEVHDSGPGISPELRSRLFSEFEQGAEGGGSGLGLAISRQLIRRMGGEIGVDDRPGGGSVFWVQLDLPEAPGAHT